MKRGMSGRGRRGAPPVGRQKIGLRVTQITFAVLALFLWWLTYRSYGEYSIGEAGLDQLLIAGWSALIATVVAIGMGGRTVRGPNPPRLDE